MKIDRITLRGVVPEIFAATGSETSVHEESEIWLRELSFERPEHYLVAAGSGTGKSSLCSYIYGNRSDYRGTISFDGVDIRSFGIGQWAEIRRRALALLPQEMRIFPELTVIENIEIKNRLTGWKSREEIMEMLRRLEIEEKAGVAARLLSIGQQQRVAVIRTLCQPFSFLLLDEPVSHLDERNNAIVASLIEEEAARQDAAIIATSVGNDLSLNSVTQLRL